MCDIRMVAIYNQRIIIIIIIIIIIMIIIIIVCTGAGGNYGISYIVHGHNNFANCDFLRKE